MSVWEELCSGIVTTSPEATRAVGERVAAELPAEAVIALEGDLGVGKTTFVQGLARGLGVREAVTSPTFNLYAVHRGKRVLVHLDAYRLEGAAQVDDLLIEDFLVPPYCLVVEWPSRVAGWLPPGTRTISLEILGPGRHCLRSTG